MEPSATTVKVPDADTDARLCDLADSRVG